jgi:hypothetical protein
VIDHACASSHDHASAFVVPSSSSPLHVKTPRVAVVRPDREFRTFLCCSFVSPTLVQMAAWTKIREEKKGIQRSNNPCTTTKQQGNSYAAMGLFQKAGMHIVSLQPDS